MSRGLLGRQLLLAHQFLDERVVLGETLERAVAEQIRATVADVGDRHRGVVDVGGRQRGSHPGALAVGA